jgi:hypothetical protein
MVKQLRESEDSILRQRMAIIDMEKWLLAQEAIMTARRIEESDNELNVAFHGLNGGPDAFPYMFRPFSQPIVSTSLVDAERRVVGTM